MTARTRPAPMEVAVWFQAPALFIAYYVYLVGFRMGFRMLDFDAFRLAGHDVLHGRSPYPPADPHILIFSHHLVYPALVAYLFVPFALLPPTIAGGLWFATMIGCIAATLAVLGVRDWRCYALPYVWYPFAVCLGVGALGPPLALLLALVWRYRDRTLVSAPLLALAIVAKLFLWPVGLWLLATRRRRSAAATVALSAAAFVLPFAPLGWGTLRAYPHLLHVLNGVFGPASFSMQTLFTALGVPARGASVGVALVTALLAAAVIALGRRGDDRAAFVVALGTAILISPIAWIHYYILLVVPLAIARPRLTALWFLPIAYWAVAKPESFGDPRRLVFAMGITAFICVRTALFTPPVRLAQPRRIGVAARRVTETIQTWTW